MDSLQQRLELAGVVNLAQTEVDETIDVFRTLCLLSHLSKLPNIEELITFFKRGFSVPQWWTSFELRTKLTTAQNEAEKEADSRFNKIEDIINVICKKMKKDLHKEKSQQSSTTQTLEILPIPGRCVLFDALEAGTCGANNVVVDGYYWENRTEAFHTAAIKVVSISKVASMGSIAVDRMVQEASLSLLVKNSNVVRTHKIQSFSGMLLFMMEQANKGDLVNLIRKCGALPESQARNIFWQLCSGLNYLHEKNIVHRDIKPENILLSLESNEQKDHPYRWRALLADLGAASKMVEGQKFKDSLGTMSYAAPEVYDGREVDIWSLAITLYAMIYGKLPWELHKMSLNAAYQALLKQHLVLPDTSQSLSPSVTRYVSIESRDLLQRMIRIDPQDRYKLKDILSHRWWTLNLSTLQLSLQPHQQTFRQPLLPILHPQQRLNQSKRAHLPEEYIYPLATTKLRKGPFIAPRTKVPRLNMPQLLGTTRGTSGTISTTEDSSETLFQQNGDLCNGSTDSSWETFCNPKVPPYQYNRSSPKLHCDTAKCLSELHAPLTARNATLTTPMYPVVYNSRRSVMPYSHPSNPYNQQYLRENHSHCRQNFYLERNQTHSTKGSWSNAEVVSAMNIRKDMWHLSTSLDKSNVKYPTRLQPLTVMPSISLPPCQISVEAIQEATGTRSVDDPEIKKADLINRAYCTHTSISLFPFPPVTTLPHSNHHMNQCPIAGAPVNQPCIESELLEVINGNYSNHDSDHSTVDLV